MWRILLLILAVMAEEKTQELDGETSRKVLGSSVVTSVSVIMATPNGSHHYSDAAGHPVTKPHAAHLASPIALLHPDRYEFYTFDDSGALVRRLMTLAEIRDIVATGDGGDALLPATAPEQRVDMVVHSVQSVLTEEMKAHRPPARPPLDTPDVSATWSMILPAVFGNSGADIRPERPITHVTPDTIIYEPIRPQKPIIPEKTTKKPILPVQKPVIKVEIVSNGNTTSISENNKFETNKRPIYHIGNEQIKATTFRPIRSTTQFSSRPSTPSQSTTLKITNNQLNTPISTTTFKLASTSIKPTTSTIKPTTSSIKPSTSTIKQTTVTTQQSTTTIKQTTDPIKQSTSTTSTTIRPATVPIQTMPLQLTIQTSNKPITSTTSTENTGFTTENNLPSLLDILNTFHSQSYSNSDEKTKLETTESDTATEATSTFGPFSTFFTISEKETTTLPTVIVDSDDLSTLGTEQVTKTVGTTLSEQSTKDLEQYLLSSTNIYEINTELSKKVEQEVTQLSEEPTERFYIKIKSPESSTKGVDPTSEIPSTFSEFGSTFNFDSTSTISDRESTTVREAELTFEPVSTTLKELSLEATETTSKTTFEPTLNIETSGTTLGLEQTTTNEPTSTETIQTTTDQNLIKTIEELLNQVNSVDEPIDNNGSATKIEQMMIGSNNKTMSDYQAEAATFGSTLIVNNAETTTVESDTSERGELEMLNESMESLLSQVYGTESTTIDTVSESTSTSEASGTSTIQIVDFTTTTNVLLEDNNNLINLTVVRYDKNGTKPAKSDTSLEMEYQEILDEINKNFTLNELGEVTTKLMEEPTVGTKVVPTVEVNIDENRKNWTLVSTLSPHSPEMSVDTTSEAPSYASIGASASPVDLVPKPMQGYGLEDSTSQLDGDIYNFVQLCNELAFGFWKSVSGGVSSARGLVTSPFAATSLLAMVFLGARGATSGEMNEVLKLDDMVTFNPHLIFKNVSESIESGGESGVALSVIVRELYSDRSKGQLLGFYKDRVRQFYDGLVEEVGFREIGDVIRRRTNLLVKKESGGRIAEFLKDATVVPKAPLAGVSISIFQTDCSKGSTAGRDGELYFLILPTLRQRRLVPIPATVFRSHFLAGYEPSLDATAAALNSHHHATTTIFLLPGQQGAASPADGLARLERRLAASAFTKGAWARLLRALIPRPGLELQLPRFVHRSVINATHALRHMGLEGLFDAKRADLKGLNGAAHDLHLSDVLQVNEFATCGEEEGVNGLGEGWHREVYPAGAEWGARRGRRSVMREGRRSRMGERKRSKQEEGKTSKKEEERRSRESDWEEPRDYQRAFHDPLHDPSNLMMPLALRPRQARLPETPRLRFDRPFLYVVRHNPTGLILHMGRFHPRLLP